MKMRFKRFLSGFMAVATLASVIVQPVTVSASELEPETTSFEQQYPELQDVQDTLDKDEIVEAKDIEIPYGEEFEVEVDLSGIEGVNEKKVKVLFHEAKSEAGTDFDAHTPDTYKAVYAVEPVSGHPAYRVSRNITVKEPETEAQTKSSSENTVGEGNAGETEDSGNAEEDVDSDGSKEIVTDLTDGQEVTTDEESGLTVSEVMDQAENEGIDLYEMEPGETVTFMAAAGNARSSQQVSVTRGAEYRYADYGYGTYLTYQYTVKFGNVSATAYCVQPSKPGPGTGTYTINKVGDGKALAKVCYYGTKASGDDGFFTEENGYGSPLVQKAIADMEKYLDEKHGRVKETEHTTETVIGSGQKPSEVAADRRAEQEPVSVNRSQPQKAEPASRAKGEVKKSVLQSLKDFQARAKAQEQNKTTEKSKTHKKGEVEL